MPRQFFSGNSIEQAVMSAARHYQIDPERLAYKPREKKHGFLNIRRRVVIEVDPENLEIPEKPVPSPTEPVASAEVEERSVSSDDEVTAENAEEVAASIGEEDQGADGTDGHEAEESESGDSEYHGSEDDEDRDSGDDGSEDQDSDDREESRSDDDRDERGSDRGGRGGRGRGGRGRGRQQGGDRERQRPRDVTIEEFSWNSDEDGWDADDVEEGESSELAAVELCVERILDVMDMEIEYTITEGDAMDLEFSGEDAEFLIEDNGKVLKAIEHIVPRMVRGLIGRSIAVNADCEGFRADHEDSLKRAAEETAREVVRQGKAKTMSPMNPADRRIVHMALVEYSGVNTVSQGHGFMKRVKIIPADD